MALKGAARNVLCGMQFCGMERWGMLCAVKVDVLYVMSSV